MAASFKDLTEIQKTLLPTEAEVIHYQQTGWFVSKKILPDTLIETAQKAAIDFYAGAIDYPLKNNKGIANEVFNTETSIQNNEFVTLQKKELRNLGHHIMVAAIAAKLAQTNQIRLFADSLINKLPEKEKHKGIVGWHSDKAYWPTCTSNHMLTAWIPLQDVTIDMGPLTHIDGSHKWKEDLQLKKFYSFNNQDLSLFEEYLSKYQKDHIKSPMILKKGQVSFHNCHTIHCSYSNTSTLSRMALAVHFQDESNYYMETFDAFGKKIKIGYDNICSKDANGNPDYSDNYLFPLIYKL